MGERRVPTSQVFLDASERGLLFPLHPCAGTNLEGAYCVSSVVSGRSLPFKNSLSYWPATKKTPGQKCRASLPRPPPRVTPARVTPCSQRHWPNTLI